MQLLLHAAVCEGLWQYACKPATLKTNKPTPDHPCPRIHYHHCFCFYKKTLRKSPCLGHIKQLETYWDLRSTAIYSRKQWAQTKWAHPRATGLAKPGFHGTFIEEVFKRGSS